MADWTRGERESAGPLELRVLTWWKRFWTRKTRGWLTAWPPRSPGSNRPILLSLCPDQLALDIDRDAEDQNRYLDGMDSDFTSMTSLLTGSVKRFSTMARSGRDNRKLLCGVAVGLIVAFFILSYLLSRART
ncbi:BET1-like protein isoform X2 [Nycticebus coucang]|uniref:BET1-like protein isoform X2 n=1 Tax=Nycticebus coucang TaxID=9470 RepID=UPI00234DD9DE|nr:BET1-like protein isoform X2 [Nycticebus coucang]